MSRLTERTRYGIVGNNDRVINYPLHKIADADPLDRRIVGQCFEKLVDYEDAEEQGLLLRLPCKVGDRVYNLVPTVKNASTYEENIVLSIKIYNNSIVIYFDNGLGKDIKYFGESVFLTKEEAEQKLESMKGE